MRRAPATSDQASVVALQALAFLARDDDRLGRFLALSGLELEDLRARAGDAALQAGVLEYLLANETLLLDFCGEAGLKPEAPRRAHMELLGDYRGE